MVILKAINPKTKETMLLPPFKLPPTHKHLVEQATAVEARHFAATYGLFRVCSMKNVHMMLPPKFRDLWKGDFTDLKKDDVKEGRAWMYEADPFAAKQEREEAQALMTKKREDREKDKAKIVDQPGVQLRSASGGGGHNHMRGWTRVPRIEMGKRTRVQVEDLVRQHVIWNPHGVQMSEFQQRNIVKEFTDLGFRRSHIEEAVAECRDREETLEWLLIHVPEDDLPKWSLPEGYVAGISMASGNLLREASIRRLCEPGYAAELCERLLDAQSGDEACAAETLQDTLMDRNPRADTEEPGVASLAISIDNDAQEIWIEEQDTLESIFADRYLKISSDQCQVHLRIPHSKLMCTLHVRKSKSYPHTAPIVSVSCSSLPAYIRLSIIRRVVKHAETDHLGQPMVFDLVDWLELHVPQIVENPGRLRDVAAGTLAAEQNSEVRQHKGWRPASMKRPPIDWRPGSPQSKVILDKWKARQTTHAQIKMLSTRKSLPAWQLREDIIDNVNSNQVTIISGETGSGKSTQSVQFILDDLIQRCLGGSANIICTQPRRISALGLADRVSDERCTAVGDEVGYAIRGEAKQKPGITKITFVTTGVLLRRLQTSGGSNEAVLSSLSDVSHVVVDEVHERSLDTDFLLIILRDILPKRQDLKVILMSATLDAGVFEKYFQPVSSVGRIEIHGRTYPIDDYYLDDIVRQTGFNARSKYGDEEFEDKSETSVGSTLQNLGMRVNYDLIASTVRAIDAELGSADGGILIFLPGVMEINRTLDSIRTMPNIHALPLHASLMPIEQRRVFGPPPKGKRKVVVATNVAETSITIEDIVAVVDTGKVKETRFDPANNMVKLEEVWASRAACKQRRGRAGRVRPGACYKLYTRNAESKMTERPEPEIRRVPLEQLCLSVRATGVKDVSSFLAGALTPPESMAVEGAMELLRRMGAIDADDLTALGQHLAMIPADLRCGKLMVYGAMFGCLEPCLVIAAILTVKSPFVSPQNKREESKAARSSFAQGQGDLLGDLRAFEEWSSMRESIGNQRQVRSWCDENYLSYQTLTDISSNRTQYLTSLKEAGFVPYSYNSFSSISTLASKSPSLSLNAQSSSFGLLRALIAGAFNPQLARIEFPDKKYATTISGAVELDPEARTIKYFNEINGRVFVHPSSTMFDAQGFPGGTAYMSYFNKMATSKVFVRELTRT